MGLYSSFAWLLLLRSSKALLASALFSEHKAKICARSTNVVLQPALPNRSGTCLESDQLYAELKVGDTLIVEGKSNWIGLLVDRPIAVRDADSGLERSVRITPRQQPTLAQLDDDRLIPKIK